MKIIENESSLKMLHANVEVSRFIGKVFIGIFIVVFCSGSTILEYTPTLDLTLQEAVDTIEELLLTQPQTYRPDTVLITEDYIGVGYGTVSKGKTKGIGIGLGAIGVGSARSNYKTRFSGEKFYYSALSKVQLMEWRGKWFVVTFFGIEGTSNKHILYTLSRERSERFINAVEYLRTNHGKFTDEDIFDDDEVDSNGYMGVEEKLTKLKELFDKGLITEDEYKQKKADVLSEL